MSDVCYRKTYRKIRNGITSWLFLYVFSRYFVLFLISFPPLKYKLQCVSFSHIQEVGIRDYFSRFDYLYAPDLMEKNKNHIVKMWCAAAWFVTLS
jgi:hypothetical protein